MDSLREKQLDGLARLMEREGMTLKSLSAVVGRNAAYFHQFKTRNTPRVLPVEVLEKLAMAFNVDQTTLLPVVTPNVKIAESPPELPPRDSMSYNIPVYGTAAGSDRGAMILSERIDFVARTPALANRVGVYALRVVGDSMSPAHEHGALVFVDSNKPTRAGDYVIIQTRTDEGEREAYIKRLVRQNSAQVIVEQINPDIGEIAFDMSRVDKIHKVMTTDEIFGI